MESTINIINKSHPDAVKALALGGLFAENQKMEVNIGRVVKFTNWVKSMGTLKRDYTYTIIGVQKTYNGTLAYRVFCNGFTDTFGSVAEVAEIQFID